MPEQSSGFKYPQIVQEARQLPAPSETEQGNVTELIPLVDGNKLKNPFVAEESGEEKVGVELAYRVFSRVFVIWRPWEICKRCQDDLDTQKVVLPNSGDYSCPHTQAVEYKEIVDRCLKGDGVVSTKEAFNLKNGTRCVHLEWLEADPERMAEFKKQEAERIKNQVYPPDVAGAFAKK
jgi:hypothetical protein